MFEAGDGELLFVGCWAGWGEGVPSSGVAFFVEFWGGVDHGDVLADVEHREIRMTVGKSMAVCEDGSGGGIESFWEDGAHFLEFVGSFVIASDDVGDEADAGVDFYGGAKVVIESEFFSDGFDPDFWACGAEHGGVAEDFLLRKDFDYFSVKRFRKVLLDKGLRQFIQIFSTKSPEVIEKNTLHALGADDFGEGEQWDEKQEVESANGHPLQHKITKEQLGIPWDQSLIEVKKRVTLMMRRV